ncbi:hypothetical protein FIBSPDRAFT_7001 [Athelia psychrophila]|uniref:Uncharacterized protein n=1 Tax=Athelia psychrophila TaxID=1759441 RepID=A0A166X3Q6_9AGAM|nr:hypothetical protein FIBSPDRAFT_7001 [Fibularhizoctonia sp. CBS 109695]
MVVRRGMSRSRGRGLNYKKPQGTLAAQPNSSSASKLVCYLNGICYSVGQTSPLACRRTPSAHFLSKAVTFSLKV